MTRVALLSAVLALSLAGCGLSAGTATSTDTSSNSSFTAADAAWYGVQDLQATGADGAKLDPAALKQKAFDALDTDKSGGISLAEFKAGKPPMGPGGPGGAGGPGHMAPMGHPPGGQQLTDEQKADLEAMRKELDTKRQELEQAFLQKHPEIEAQRAQEQAKHFDAMDTDKNGQLSLAELKPPPRKGPGGPGGQMGGGHGPMMGGGIFGQQ